MEILLGVFKAPAQLSGTVQASEQVSNPGTIRTIKEVNWLEKQEVLYTYQRCQTRYFKDETTASKYIREGWVPYGDAKWNSTEDSAYYIPATYTFDQEDRCTYEEWMDCMLVEDFKVEEPLQNTNV